MKTKEEILARLKEELPHLRKQFHVKTIGVFGSYARGEQTGDSDIDVLVEFDGPVGFFKFIRLEDHLSERLGLKVDLVTPEALKPRIKPHIMENVAYA